MSACSSYNDITTSIAEINETGLKRQRLATNNGPEFDTFEKTYQNRDVTYFEISIPPEFITHFKTLNNPVIIKSWKLRGSYYDNIIIEVHKAGKTRHTERLDDKGFLKLNQNSIDKYGENIVLKELKKLYDSPKLLSIENNLKINDKFFGRWIYTYKLPADIKEFIGVPLNVNINALEYHCFTIHDGVRYNFLITFLGNKNVAEKINFVNNIFGTIKFK